MPTDLDELRRNWEAIKGGAAGFLPNTKQLLALLDRLERAEQDMEQVKLRLACIARLTLMHELHTGRPEDDCMGCYPHDIAHELKKFAAMKAETSEPADPEETP